MYTEATLLFHELLEILIFEIFNFPKIYPYSYIIGPPWWLKG